MVFRLALRSNSHGLVTSENPADPVAHATNASGDRKRLEQRESLIPPTKEDKRMIKRFQSLYDVESCDGNIDNPEKLKKLIREIVEAIGMRIVFGPFVANGSPVAQGTTAIAIIDLSHISIHTFTESRQAFVDVFSIREFDHEAVEKLIKTALGTPKTVARHRRV